MIMKEEITHQNMTLHYVVSVVVWKLLTTIQSASLMSTLYIKMEV